MVHGARCEVRGVAGSSTSTVTVMGTLQSEAGVASSAEHLRAQAV